jgi:hypothetical protein
LDEQQQQVADPLASGPGVGTDGVAARGDHRRPEDRDVDGVTRRARQHTECDVRLGGEVGRRTGGDAFDVTSRVVAARGQDVERRVVAGRGGSDGELGEQRLERPRSKTARGRPRQGGGRRAIRSFPDGDEGVGDVTADLVVGTARSRVPEGSRLRHQQVADRRRQPVDEPGQPVDPDRIHGLTKDSGGDVIVSVEQVQDRFGLGDRVAGPAAIGESGAVSEGTLEQVARRREVAERRVEQRRGGCALDDEVGLSHLFDVIDESSRRGEIVCVELTEVPALYQGEPGESVGEHAGRQLGAAVDRSEGRPDVAGITGVDDPVERFELFELRVGPAGRADPTTVLSAGQLVDDLAMSAVQREVPDAGQERCPLGRRRPGGRELGETQSGRATRSRSAA